MSKMKVQIIKNSERFHVQRPYNLKILKLIRRIKNRYYNIHNKTWYLPIKDYEQFKDSLTKLNEIEYDVLDSRPVVYIKLNGDKIEVKFSKFIEQFSEYLEFKGRCYHSNERKLTIPIEHFNAVVLLSKELGFEVVSDEIIVD